MLQVDRKITCETLAPHEPAASGAADFPPESFYVPKNDESDWLDRNAFYERKDSAKANEPNSTVTTTSSNHHHKFALNLKSSASIIGLPKTRKAALAAAKRRTCKPANIIRLFPKRSGSTGKSTDRAAEPGSPKVSCMGRVRSKRCRRRSNSLKRTVKPVESNVGTGRAEKQNKKTTFYSKVMSIFQSNKGRSAVEVTKEEPVVVEPRRKSAVREIPRATESDAEPPMLGGMKRFASKRQSGCVMAEEFNQVQLDDDHLSRR